MTTLSQHWVQDYYDLQDVLVESDLITVISGTQTDTPTVTGTADSIISGENVTITVTDYTPDQFYWAVASGTVTASGSSEYIWTAPSVTGDHDFSVYTINEGAVLSNPGQWRVSMNVILGWNGNTVTVGSSGRDFTVIQDAVDAASVGDMILIDPGTYSYVNVNKHVHLKARSTNLDIDTVLIYDNLSSPGCAINIGLSGSSSFYNNEKYIYIEGLRAYCEASWRRGILFSGLTATDMNVFVSKCEIGTASGSTYSMRSWDATGNDSLLRIINCKLLMDYRHFLYFDNPFTLESVELSSELSFNDCDAYPNPDDYVITPTVGYGYGYGNFILPQ